MKPFPVPANFCYNRMKKKSKGFGCELVKIRNVAVIGMGAIGSVYGKFLYECYGDNFFVIADGTRRQSMEIKGIRLNGETYYPNIISPDEVKKRAQLLLVCVKNYQLDQAIQDMKNFVNSSTMILPLLNGVTATHRLQEAFPQAHVFYGVAIGIDAVRSKQGVMYSNCGSIQFGDEKNKLESQAVVTAKRVLLNSGLSVQVFDDMKRVLWRKWMLNIGFNQVSALSRATYGRMLSVPEVWMTMEAAMKEVLAIARKMQIDLDEQDIKDFKSILHTMSEQGKTSMLQDVEGSRKTEVEYFSGTILAYGKRFQVPVPVNTTLYQLIKGLEASYLLQPDILETTDV